MSRSTAESTHKRQRHEDDALAAGPLTFRQTGNPGTQHLTAGAQCWHRVCWKGPVAGKVRADLARTCTGDPSFPAGLRTQLGRNLQRITARLDEIDGLLADPGLTLRQAAALTHERDRLLWQQAFEPLSGEDLARLFGLAAAAAHQRASRYRSQLPVIFVEIDLARGAWKRVQEDW